MTDLTSSANQTSQRVSQNTAAAHSRTAFIRKTYVHLGGALITFALICAGIQLTPLAGILNQVLFSNSFVAFLVLIGFIGATTLAQRWSLSDNSKSMQYVGLLAYIVLEAIIFTPILFIFVQGAPELLALAVAGTVIVSGLLTLMAFTSGTDFKFLRSFLAIGGLLALGVILLSFIFPALATSFIFLGFMLVFASAAILFQTSKVIRDYPDDKYVAASLGLFASIVLLFWYVLSFILRLTSK